MTMDAGSSFGDFHGASARVSEHVLFEQLGETVVLLDLKSEQYYELNGVGSRFWVLVQEHSNLDQVLAVMLQEFEVDEDTLIAEVRKFIDRVEGQGWLRIYQGTST